MTIDRLPEGARLALLNWPGGQPTLAEIAESAGRDTLGRRRGQGAYALLRARLIEAVSVDPTTRLRDRRFRLTQAGRKAVDVLQSGVE